MQVQTLCVFDHRNLKVLCTFDHIEQGIGLLVKASLWKIQAFIHSAIKKTFVKPSDDILLLVFLQLDYVVIKWGVGRCVYSTVRGSHAWQCGSSCIIQPQTTIPVGYCNSIVPVAFLCRGIIVMPSSGKSLPDTFLTLHVSRPIHRPPFARMLCSQLRVVCFCLICGVQSTTILHVRFGN